MLSMKKFFAKLGFGELCLLVLLCLFGWMYSSTVYSHGSFMWDEAEYASIGRSVIQGDGFSINKNPNGLRPPLLPLSGSVAMLISGSMTDTTLKYSVVFFCSLGTGYPFSYCQNFDG